MKLRIEIDCQDATFEDELRGELARVLRHLQYRLDYVKPGEPDHIPVRPGIIAPLVDQTGKRIGAAKFES